MKRLQAVCILSWLLMPLAAPHGDATTADNGIIGMLEQSGLSEADASAIVELLPQGVVAAGTGYLAPNDESDIWTTVTILHTTSVVDRITHSGIPHAGTPTSGPTVVTVAPTASGSIGLASPSPSSAPATGSVTPAADIKQYLDAHNSARACHGATDLTWSNALAANAKNWTSNCQFKHSGGIFGRLGENLAAGTGDYSPARGVGDWVKEGQTYDRHNPQPSHFTQVVWKATTQVGCASSQCNDLFGSNSGPATFHSCMYSPAGNVLGGISQNVQA